MIASCAQCWNLAPRQTFALATTARDKPADNRRNECKARRICEQYSWVYYNKFRQIAVAAKVGFLAAARCYNTLMPSREEHANTVVAQVLNRLLGMEVRAEVSGRADGRLLDFHIAEHRIVLEAKYDDFAAAVQAAQNRWDNMHPPPTIVGAISYHRDFRENVGQAIRHDAAVEFALSGNRHADLHALKRIGTVYDLAQSLRRPAAILNPNTDEIEQAIGEIEDALAAFYGVIKNNRGTLYKMANILQASFNGDKEEEVYEQSARVAGLILFGAFLFQLALSHKHQKVTPPTTVDDLVKIRQQWDIILTINYVAIFGVAKRLLTESGVLKSWLTPLIDTAVRVQELAADGIDLMGRVYHQLLVDAKPLGAFYTSVPAATLMAGLALHSKNWGDDETWADLDFIKDFRIADPACGSGTLLAATCWQMRDNFSRADAKINGVTIGGKKTANPLDKLHRHLLENVIWGYDILETAGHLTATTLGLMSPEVDFRKAHIYRTIIGDTNLGAAAGSLEILEGTPIFKRDQQVEKENPEEVPELDLCVMNPPFVRGTIGHEAFSFLPPKERIAVHNRIRHLGKLHQFVSDKGQGAAFVALACQQKRQEFRIKEGGCVAIILPSTFAVGMGKAWSGARAKIEKHFDLEILIVSRQNGRPNFSENTKLQECIIIARKRKNGDKPKKKALFVVLSSNPQTVDESHATVRAIKQAKISGGDIGDLRIDGESNALPGITNGVIGQYAFLPWHGRNAWRGVSFANLYLSLAAENFAVAGNLNPFVKKGKVPLKLLKELAGFGSHRLNLYLNARIVKDRRCRISPTPTAYPGYYPGHYRATTGIWQKDLCQISEKPQCYILPLPQHEQWAENFYTKAGRIVLCDSFGFNTMRRLATLISEPVQASHYWPIKLHHETEQRLKAMTLWLNSTPSLLLIANFAQSTYGAKVCFCQAAAKDLPVFDLNTLTKQQLKKLASLFDKIAKGDGFLPIPHMVHDETRKQIDSAFAEICGLGDLSPLREALAVEPIITNQSLGAAAD